MSPFILDYNTNVELVFQGTSLVGGNDHPMHLHGFSFYVVGSGLGNFDKDKDPLGYNLVDPPLQNTIAVPIDGWTAIRFKADNPGSSLYTNTIINVTSFNVFFLLITQANITSITTR